MFYITREYGWIIYKVCMFYILVNIWNISEWVGCIWDGVNRASKQGVFNGSGRTFDNGWWRCPPLFMTSSTEGFLTALLAPTFYVLQIMSFLGGKYAQMRIPNRKYTERSFYVFCLLNHLIWHCLRCTHPTCDVRQSILPLLGVTVAGFFRHYPALHTNQSRTPG